MGRRFCEDDMPSGICEMCGRYVTAHVIDEGIGPYEFWGPKENTTTTAHVHRAAMQVWQMVKNT